MQVISSAAATDSSNPTTKLCFCCNAFIYCGYLLPDWAQLSTTVSRETLVDNS